jgi:DNA-binding CsgD family transcriptional regulator
MAIPTAPAERPMTQRRLAFDKALTSSPFIGLPSPYGADSRDSSVTDRSHEYVERRTPLSTGVRCRAEVVRFGHMSNAISPENLRPVERRVLDMQREGVVIDEIASRLRRTPEFVARIIGWTEIPRNGTTADRDLTPMQRRVLDLRANGESYQDIAAKFRKGEAYIRQVEGLAYFKESQRLLSRD